MNVEEIISILELADSFIDSKRQMETLLPYHLNVIDELNINENGHSRVLAKLLQYKSENQRYAILESLLEYISKIASSNSFGTIKIIQPEITQEKERIDLWVRDKDYAIIFENKIYNAADQEAQLCRYIDKTKKYGFNEAQIFVVYLTQNEGKPEKQSWGCYEETFQGHYVNLSFRSHILPWMKEQVLPNIRIKESTLRSAIEQYVDYLDGLFDSRTQNNAIRMETERMLIERLNLDKIENDLEKVRFLQDKITEINALSNQLTNMKDKYYDAARRRLLEPHIQKWKSEINSLFPKYEKCKVVCHVGLIVPFGGDFINVRISEDDDKQMYCQIDKYGFANDELNSELKEIMRKELTRHSGNKCIWKYFDINDFEGVFKCFKDVMSLLVDNNKLTTYN